MMKKCEMHNMRGMTEVLQWASLSPEEDGVHVLAGGARHEVSADGHGVGHQAGRHRDGEVQLREQRGHTTPHHQTTLRVLHQDVSGRHR